MDFRLVDDWKRLLRTAWSARFSAAAALFGALEIGVQLMAPQWGGWGAAAAMLASLLATLSRVVYQASLHKADQERAR